jgi:hypothetical protein
VDRGVRKGTVTRRRGGVDRKVAGGVDLRVEVVGGGGLVEVAARSIR